MESRVNYKCSAFPCHKEIKLQGCTFCYCPVYPCQTMNLGNSSNCTWPHDQRRENELFRFLKKNGKDNFYLRNYSYISQN